MEPMPRHTVWTSIAGAIAVTAYAVLAAVQILVLNPLAAAPGLSLDEIHARMTAVNEDPASGRSLVILGTGVALALGVAVVSIVRRAPAVVPAMTLLALLAFGAVGYFVASFSSGMALADTFGISGGDHSPWARPLYAVSALAAIAVIVTGVVVATRSRPMSGTGPAAT